MPDFERGAGGRQNNTTSKPPGASATAPGKVPSTARLPARAKPPGRRAGPPGTTPPAGPSPAGPPAQPPVAMPDEGLAEGELITDEELAAAKIESRLAHGRESTAEVLAALAAYRERLRAGQQPWQAVLAATRTRLAALAQATEEPAGTTSPPRAGERSKPALIAVSDAADRLADVVQEQMAVLERAGSAASDAADPLAALQAALQALDARSGLAEAARLESLAKELEARRDRSELGEVRKQLITLAQSYRAWRKGKAWRKLRAQAEKAVRRRKPGGDIDQSHGAPAWRPSRHPDGGPERFDPPPLEASQIAHIWKLVRIEHIMGKEVLKTKQRDGFEEEDLTDTFKARLQELLLAAYRGQDISPFLDQCNQALREARPDLDPDLLVDAMDQLRKFAKRVLQTSVTTSSNGSNDPGAALDPPTRPDTQVRSDSAKDPSSDQPPIDRLKPLADELNAARQDPATRPMAEEILTAGASWPFGPLHYYERLKVGYTRHGITDIFAHYRSAFVTYDFFGQQVIEIGRVCVAPLQHAEKLYFTAARTMGLPATVTFEVSPNTAAYNFRGHRQNVQQRLLLNAEQGALLQHNTGRAIDVNTTGGRNPHVKQDRSIWLPVEAVLIHAGRPDLAAIPFSQAGKGMDDIGKMLEASRVYQRHYAAWKKSYPGSLVVPFGHLPTPEEFTAALQAAGLGASSPALVSERKTAQAADRDADKARARLRDAQRARQRVMLRAARTARGQLGKKLRKQQEEPYGAHRTMLLRSLGRVDSALLAWGTSLALSPGESGSADAWRAAARAVDDALIELRLILKTFGHLAPFGPLSPPGAEQAEIGFPRAVAETWRAVTWGTLSGTSTDSIVTGKRELESRDGWVDQTVFQPHLMQRGQAERELALLTAHRKFRGELTAWAKQGFVDHPALFVWAMKQAGWRYGGEYSTPDFHHFEWLR